MLAPHTPLRPAAAVTGICASLHSRSTAATSAAEVGEATAAAGSAGCRRGPRSSPVATSRGSLGLGSRRRHARPRRSIASRDDPEALPGPPRPWLHRSDRWLGSRSPRIGGESAARSQVGNLASRHAARYAATARDRCPAARRRRRRRSPRRRARADGPGYGERARRRGCVPSRGAPRSTASARRYGRPGHERLAERRDPRRPAPGPRARVGAVAAGQVLVGARLERRRRWPRCPRRRRAVGASCATGDARSPSTRSDRVDGVGGHAPIGRELAAGDGDHAARGYRAPSAGGTGRRCGRWRAERSSGRSPAQVPTTSDSVSCSVITPLMAPSR